MARLQGFFCGTDTVQGNEVLFKADSYRCGHQGLFFPSVILARPDIGLCGARLLVGPRAFGSGLFTGHLRPPFKP